MELQQVGRWLMISVNVIFTFLGLLVAAAGIFLLVQASALENDVELLQDLPLKTTAYVIMFVGFALAITSIIGVIGAWKKQRVMLTIYLFVIFAVVLLQMCIGIYLYQYDSSETIDSLVENKWFQEGEEARDRRIDYQDFFHCCGWNNIYDSRAAGYDTPCTQQDPPTCKQATLDWLAIYFTPVAITAIVFAALEFISLLATLAILCTAKEVEEEETWLI
mmetsp:Transcript_20385/g.36260  ORF Transcript_20385/g.36260 Transcript_20385/m.36260 type:complete len:220 (+) Transcript_20385:150-809(+)|eukprot:CAMPEP_0197540872 /NCGR_PEP_ID=MMETSP1318-20131121/66834_1 /TAXON_ID=552666 /ORGANISM="Partenskyella glossopodia, Strain RCC365" /LENGTH=219 /DNA_ID=CAMNT_0043099981 /DNA_START=136 /DNA_END=795 /DNA_ORIENTATION=-